MLLAGETHTHSSRARQQNMHRFIGVSPYRFGQPPHALARVGGRDSPRTGWQDAAIAQAGRVRSIKYAAHLECYHFAVEQVKKIL